MALIMIVFMIALASAVLISLSESTYLAMRLNAAAEQRIKAEYILKSAVNVARVLIKNDITPSYDDPTQDVWMMFSEGREVPGSLLGIPDPNVRVSLLITSANGKLPILMASNPSWTQALLSLLKTLGFDQPLPMNEARDGSLLASPEEMIANLIDYIDSDTDNFTPNTIITKPGIEADLPNGQQFPNSGTILSLTSELPGIPGFSPARIQRLLPFITDRKINAININAASAEVINSVLLDPTAASKIEACRNPAQGGGPIQGSDDLTNRCGVSVGGSSVSIDYKGDHFDVIAKVEYGTATFMASAQLQSAAAGAGGGRYPNIKSLQLY